MLIPIILLYSYIILLYSIYYVLYIIIFYIFYIILFYYRITADILLSYNVYVYPLLMFIHDMNS